MTYIYKLLSIYNIGLLSVDEWKENDSNSTLTHTGLDTKEFLLFFHNEPMESREKKIHPESSLRLHAYCDLHARNNMALFKKLD